MIRRPPRSTRTDTLFPYTTLFRSDLMLLSVPDVYERMLELVAAAQRGYSPKRIILLSDTPTLTYSLLNLPSVLAGYISKYSSPEVLSAAIMLVLAGGNCFPAPDRSEERRVGKGGVSPCRSGWAPKH